MPFVVCAALLSCDGERLARRRAGPEFAIIRPAGETSSKSPPTNASEKMTLLVPDEIVGRDFFDAAFIDISVRNVARGHQVAEPLRCERFVLVVVVRHVELRK